MDTAKAVSEIHEYAQHAAAKRMLRKGGYGSLLFGVLAVFIGIDGLVASQLNLILVALGVLLLVSGGLSILRPGLSALVLSGVTLLLIAAWNAFVFTRDLHRASAPRGQLIVWAVAQAIWAARLLGPKTRAACARIHETPSELAGQIDQMLNMALAAREKNGAECVELACGNFWGMRYYSGKLADAMMILVDKAGGDACCAAPADVSLTLKNEKMKRKGNKGRLRVGDRTMSIVISQISAERIQRWLRAATPVA